MKKPITNTAQITTELTRGDELQINLVMDMPGTALTDTNGSARLAALIQAHLKLASIISGILSRQL